MEYAAAHHHLEAVMLPTRGVLADGLDEEAEVGLGIVEPQKRRAIAVDGAVKDAAAHLVAFTFAVVLVAATDPEIVGPRGVAARGRDVDRGGGPHAI